MTKVCFAPDCNHKSGQNTCSFHRFPKTPSRRGRWVKRVRRADRLPNDNDALCSCHFVESALSPTVFKRNSMYAHIFRRPEGHKKKTGNVRKKLLTEDEPDLLSPSPEERPSFTVTALSSDDALAAPLDDAVDPLPDAIVEINYSSGPEIRTPAASSHTKFSEMQDSYRKRLVQCRRLFRFQTEKSKDLKGTLLTLQTRNEVLTQELEKKKSTLLVTITEKKDAETEIVRLKNVIASLENKLFSERAARIKCEEIHNELKLQLKEDQDKLQIVGTKLASVEGRLQKSNTAKCSALRAQKTLSEELTAEKYRLLIENISTLDCKVSHYTGLPNNGTFKWLLSLFDNYTLTFYKFNVTAISKENQLFMTLMRLKLGLGLQTLADWFRCSKATVSNIVMTWVSGLHTVLFEGFMGTIPSLAKVQQSLPECFKQFASCRIVLDCTEVVTVVPKNMRKHNLTYSNYKHRTTFKGLVGIAPNGTCVFASKLYPGSTSDKAVVESSEIAKVFNPGESIMVDKGFLIGDLLPAGVSLIRPPFKTTAQFTEQQVVDSRKISKARVHVERAIERIKRYKILQLIPANLAPRATIVFQVCCALTNLQKPLIAEVAGALMEGANSSDEED